MKQSIPTSFKYLDIVVVVFIATLIISNIGSTKIVGIGPITFDGGTILFPLAYILGDVLTEVYGFRYTRRVIWLGFIVLALTAGVLGLINILPAATGTEAGATAFATIAGFIPRIVLASLIAYIIGEFINTILLAKLKVRTNGKHYWARSLAASSVGELFDTLIFSTIAFAGTLPGGDFVRLIITVYLMKLGFELIAVGFTSRIVRILKRREASDPYDTFERFRVVGGLQSAETPKR